MSDVIEPVHDQIQHQRDGREALVAAQREAEEQLRDWPAFRDVVRNAVLPAVQAWRTSLLPYTHSKPRARFARSIRRKTSRIQRMLWLHPGAIRRRMHTLGLWLLVMGPVLLQVFGILVIVGLIVLSILYRDQISAAVQNLFSNP